MANAFNTPRSLVAAAGLFLLILGASIFVWPTSYRYDRMRVRELDLPVRTNRLTGKTEALYPSGWRTLGNRDNPPTQDDKTLTGEELARLTGEARLTDYGWIKAEIYNGTTRPVREVTVELVVRDRNYEVVLQRAYALTSTMGRPLGSSEYIGNAGFTLREGQVWEWKIVGAKAR